jgi:sarcosine oxidase subunit alpha
MRIERHPILDFSRARGREVYFLFNGKSCGAYEGETIAAALIANGFRVFRISERLHEPRSIFCGIGRCGDCSMRVNGMDNVRVCQTAVEEGMVVESNLPA